MIKGFKSVIMEEVLRKNHLLSITMGGGEDLGGGEHLALTAY